MLPPGRASRSKWGTPGPSASDPPVRGDSAEMTSPEQVVGFVCRAEGLTGDPYSLAGEPVE